MRRTNPSSICSRHGPEADRPGIGGTTWKHIGSPRALGAPLRTTWWYIQNKWFSHTSNRFANPLTHLMPRKCALTFLRASCCWGSWPPSGSAALTVLRRVTVSTDKMWAPSWGAPLRKRYVTLILCLNLKCSVPKWVHLHKQQKVPFQYIKL